MTEKKYEAYSNAMHYKNQFADCNYNLYFLEKKNNGPRNDNKQQSEYIDTNA